jgi:hypothetical protein
VKRAEVETFTDGLFRYIEYVILPGSKNDVIKHHDLQKKKFRKTDIQYNELETESRAKSFADYEQFLTDQQINDDEFMTVEDELLLKGLDLKDYVKRKRSYSMGSS